MGLLGRTSYQSVDKGRFQGESIHLIKRGKEGKQKGWEREKENEGVR